MSNPEISMSDASFHCLRNSLSVHAGTLSSHREGKGHMAGQALGLDESIFLIPLHW